MRKIINILMFAGSFALAIILQTSNVISQEQSETSRAFYFDVVAFRGNADTAGRIDVFVMVPYQFLGFVKVGSIYAASYELSIRILDSNDRTVTKKTISRKISEKDYHVSQGSTGAFDATQTIFSLPKGKYDIEAIINDEFSKKTYQRSRSQTVIDFSLYPFSISGLMLISSIEERDGKYIITPHITDNVGEIAEGFFIFFETYNSSGRDSVDFYYELTGSKNKSIMISKKEPRSVKDTVTRHYMRISLPKDLIQGAFTLKLWALSHSITDSIEKSKQIAGSERSLRFFRTGYTNVMQDIVKAIKQCRYAATQSEIDNMESAPTVEEKQLRFDEFWKNLDPTPNTERNEAFDEYFSRIDYANKTFKAFGEGWRSDMAMVYVVYGPPMNNYRTNPYADSRVYEKWVYADNRQFLFVDNTGFGDFRLSNPITVTDKYRFRR